MAYVKDLKWEKGMQVDDLVKQMGSCGFQGIELKKATDVVIRMIAVVFDNLKKAGKQGSAQDRLVDRTGMEHGDQLLF